MLTALKFMDGDAECWCCFVRQEL